MAWIVIPNEGEGSNESPVNSEARQYYVYIMSSRRRVVYVGVTNNLAARVRQHRSGEIDGFTSRYNVNRLVYAESCDYIEDALNREKEIKGWRREKKVALGMTRRWALVQNRKNIA